MCPRDVSEFRHIVVGGHWYQTGNDAIGKEHVVDNFVKGWTLLRIGSENVLYKFACIARHFTVWGEFVLIITNAPDRW